MKTKRPLLEAEAEANDILDKLAPVTERRLIAGSIRRKKFEVGDIEIVVAPKYAKVGLFGEEAPDIQAIEDVLAGLGEFSKDGERFKQVQLRNGFQLDVFIIYAPVQWGYQVVIRTGDADFSHKCVTPTSQYGFLPNYLKCGDGAVWHGKQVINTPEEDDFLALLGLRGLPPEKRNLEDARRWIAEHKHG